MKPDLRNCTLEELWEYIATHLAKKDIPVVLVGGAVVTVYTQGAYVSGDLDFVPHLLIRAKEIASAMKEIGFTKSAHRSFTHPDCQNYFIDFVSPPLSIGDEIGIQPAIRQIGDVQIQILSPTDCVKDRLAGYIYFQAPECLEQAVLVAQRYQVDMQAIQNWCRREKSEWAFDDLLESLQRVPEI